MHNLHQARPYEALCHLLRVHRTVMVAQTLVCSIDICRGPACPQAVSRWRQRATGALEFNAQDVHVLVTCGHSDECIIDNVIWHACFWHGLHSMLPVFDHHLQASMPQEGLKASFKVQLLESIRHQTLPDTLCWVANSATAAPSPMHWPG